MNAITHLSPIPILVIVLLLGLAFTESFPTSDYGLDVFPRAHLHSNSPFLVRDIDVSDDQLLETELEFENIFRRVAPSAMQVNRRIKQLQTDIASYKSCSESLQRYFKVEDRGSEFHQQISGTLAAKFEHDLKNKKQIFEHHVQNERVVDTEIEELNKAGITKDAKKLKKVVEEYRHAFSTYWAEIETFMEERKIDGSWKPGSKTTGGVGSSKSSRSGKQGEGSSSRGGSRSGIV